MIITQRDKKTSCFRFLKNSPRKMFISISKIHKLLNRYHIGRYLFNSLKGENITMLLPNRMIVKRYRENVSNGGWHNERHVRTRVTHN